MSDKREQVRERLTQVWRITYPVVAFVGGVAALISFFFGDLSEILRRLEPYQTPIIGGAAFIFLIGYYFWLSWLIGRPIVRGIRGWLQKRRDSRQLRTLAVSISQVRQLVEERHIHARSDMAEVTVYLERVGAECAPLRDELIDLNVLPPGFDTDGMYQKGYIFLGDVLGHTHAIGRRRGY